MKKNIIVFLLTIIVLLFLTSEAMYIVSLMLSMEKNGDSINMQINSIFITICLTIGIITHILSFVFSLVLTIKEKKFWILLSIGTFFGPLGPLVLFIGIIFSGLYYKNLKKLISKKAVLSEKIEKIYDKEKQEELSILLKKTKNEKELEKINETINEIILNQ
ncbi:Uncharacterised protein [Mycoplasmopsis maculosa]|uniref:Uncharacterized protein n=1 Tax=Mycoplasmopsis maculosa TaxID=114885 RepID=A0A449B3F1_9BACT|nr:hypothetical protein [Mycoplasmopsis maculosa]VEU75131.1 Uncharacterised protein [Mycoplasmopsis maculosa]